MSQLKGEQKEHEPLLNNSSQQRRFPQVFKWKVAVIIVSVLSAIFLITDIVLFVDYINAEPRKHNYTFLSDIINDPNPNIQSLPRQQLLNIFTALTTSYADIWFQSSTLVRSWATPPLTLDTVRSFFDGDSDNQLFLISLTDLTDGVNNYLLSAFTHISFPLPKTWKDYLINDPLKSYYTFQIADRQSTLMGSASSSYMRMSGSTDNLLNCKIIALGSSYLRFMEMIVIDFNDTTGGKALIGSASNLNSACFEGEPDAGKALSTLQSLIGITDPKVTSLTVSQIQVYHLFA